MLYTYVYREARRTRLNNQRKELFITSTSNKAAKAANYSAAQEARIAEVAAEGVINAERAASLATELGKTTRSVIAKVIRMNPAWYQSKQPTTKTGEPVEHKDDLVAEIGRVVEGNLTGLEKAPKAALIALRNFVNSAEG